MSPFLHLTPTLSLTLILVLILSLPVSCAREGLVPEGRMPEWGPSDPRVMREKSPGARSDATLRDELLTRMTADPGIDAYRYQATVSGGQVTLRGTAPTEAQRELLGRLASTIDGVRDVRNEVTVSASEKPTSPAPTPVAKNDLELRRAVLDEILANSDVQFYGQRVRVDRGVVTLSGEAPNLKSKRAAQESASRVPGVKKIVNQLDLRPSRTIPDSKLRQEILASLAEDPYFDPDQLKIQVNRGVVDVSGRLLTLQEKDLLIDQVSQIRGVQDIHEKISVLERSPEKH